MMNCNAFIAKRWYNSVIDKKKVSTRQIYESQDPSHKFINHCASFKCTLIFYHIYQHTFPGLSYSLCFCHPSCDWRMSRIRNYSQHRWTRIIPSASRFAWILTASLKSEEVEEIDWHAKIRENNARESEGKIRICFACRQRNTYAKEETKRVERLREKYYYRSSLWYATRRIVDNVK